MSPMEYVKSKFLKEWLEDNPKIFKRIEVCEKI